MAKRLKKKSPAKTVKKAKAKRPKGRIAKTGPTKRKTPSPAATKPASKSKKKVAKKKTSSKKTTATKKKAAAKRTTPRRGVNLTKRPSATSQDPFQFPEEGTRVPKTHLSAKQLREFKELLLKKRAQLAGDVAQLTGEVRGRNSRGSGNQSSMPVHMADLGTDNWEQEFTMELIVNEHDRVLEIDDALTRIDKKTYGVCLATHRPILLERLIAKPWAKYCIDYARAREEGRVH